jgi:hypothetical protein
VRLDIAHPGSLGACESVEGAELIQHVGLQFVRCHIDPAPAETGQIPVADLRSDSDAALRGPHAHSPHDHRIAGMEPARDVRAADHVQ